MFRRLSLLFRSESSLCNGSQTISRNMHSQKSSTEADIRWSKSWWIDQSIKMTVFAITGSSTVQIVRPFVHNVLNIDGSFIDGPWSYRLCYLMITLPLYSLILITVGTAFGKGAYFRSVSLRMYSRFIPKSWKSPSKIQ